jgi:hypothetical protein
MLEKYIDYIQTNNVKTAELELRFGRGMKKATFEGIVALGNHAQTKVVYIREQLKSNNTRNREFFSGAGAKKAFTSLAKLNVSQLTQQLRAEITKMSLVTPIKAHTVTKTPLMRAGRTRHYKIDLVDEIISPAVTKPSQKNRHKFRCSWRDSMWMFDMTMVLGDIGMVTFEAEMELAAWDMGKSLIMEVANRNIGIITTIMECNSTQVGVLDIELRHGMHNSVVTLERGDITKLVASRYAVVDKADGERKYLYSDARGVLFHINPTDTSMSKTQMKLKAPFRNTLIDCELVAGVFYGFDILFYKNKDCRNWDLPARLKCMTEALHALNKVAHALSKSVEKKIFVSKKFYLTDIFTEAKRIWTHRDKLFPYTLDGLIFTPVRGTYLGHLPNFKWKEKHSIDVRVLYQPQHNFTEFYPNARPIVKTDERGREIVINAFRDRQTGATYYKSRVVQHDPQYKRLNLVNSRGVLGVRGRINAKDMTDIVELEYEPSKGQWVFLRMRSDKEVPNAFLSIKSVLSAIGDNITIDELSRLKYTPSEYERFGNTHVKCFTGVGFKFTNNEYPMGAFYEFAYTQMLGAGKTLLVLGCDGCLMEALKLVKYTSITVIEPNCLEVYGRTESEGYQGLKQRSEGLKHISVVWGDPLCIKNAAYSTIFVHSLEYMIFNTKTKKFDEKRWASFASKINSHTKIKTKLICMFMSGDRIQKALARMPCIISSDAKLHPLYKLYGKNYTPYTKFFGSKAQMVEVQRMRDSFMTECQPLVYDVDVIKALKSHKIAACSCKTIKTFEAGYKSLNLSDLSEYDRTIADITRYVIC